MYSKQHAHKLSSYCIWFILQRHGVSQSQNEPQTHNLVSRLSGGCDFPIYVSSHTRYFLSISLTFAALHLVPHVQDQHQLHLLLLLLLVLHLQRLEGSMRRVSGISWRVCPAPVRGGSRVVRREATVETPPPAPGGE